MYYKGFNYKMYWGLFVTWLFVLCSWVVVVNGIEVNKEGKGREGKMIVKGDGNDSGLPRVYVQVEEDESSENNSNDIIERSYGYNKVEERKYKSKSLRGVKGDNGKDNENEDDNVLDEDGDGYGIVYKYNKGYGGNKRMAKSIKKSRFSTNKYL